MSDVVLSSSIVLGLPLLAAILSALMGTQRTLARFAHIPTIAAFAIATLLAVVTLIHVHKTGTVSLTENALTWFRVADLDVRFSITVDPLSTVMLSTVTFVATWIALFSAGYMKGDPGFARYFALMGLFVFAMCLLVLANNFFLLVAGWEGVGVCSYLLVGYYYAKPSAANAARKAFLVTRLGDIGMIFGIFLLWQTGGYHTNLDAIFQHMADHPEARGRLPLACLLLFCGAVGKSAQLPLYVWLPDAMEGPTPISALIHAATMVTAGVYLLARCMPLFVLAPDVQLLVTVIGGSTALLAAFIALGQNDLKRVLAYSTVSQLGYMFMALGTAGQIAPSIAVTAAIFHLFTHAFFKALLFLGSGSVMHAMGNVIDMRRFGGLRKLMPVTHITFLIGCAALAGFPLLSGFWSKDAIIDTLYEAGEANGNDAIGYWIILGFALTTALMTAFYTFRAYFLTFWGEERVPPESHGHAHESPAIMRIPLIVLAVGALAVGVIVEPLTHGFSTFLGQTPSIVQANSLAGMAGEHEAHFNWMLAGISIALAFLGISIAYALYGKGGPEVVPTSLQGTWNLSRNKLYVDELYAGLFVKPAEFLATASRQFDGFLDALARLVSFLPRFGAAVLRPIQNGLVQFYALGMALGLMVFLGVVLYYSTR